LFIADCTVPPSLGQRPMRCSLRTLPHLSGVREFEVLMLTRLVSPQIGVDMSVAVGWRVT